MQTGCGDAASLQLQHLILHQSDKGRDDHDEATAHHRAMAARVNGRLADVIGAIKLHAERAPNVALFEDDGVHPLGVLSYLMACLVYAATFNCTRAVATALPWWDNGYQKPPGVKPFSKPSVPELEVAREVAWAASVAEASRAAVRAVAQSFLESQVGVGRSGSPCAPSSAGSPVPLRPPSPPT